MGRLMLKEKLIIIITLVMLLCACNMQEQQTQLAQIKAQNKIRVGVKKLEKYIKYYEYQINIEYQY